MVIDFLMFTSRPSTMQWSLISLCLNQDPLRGNGHWFPYVYIKTLYEAIFIDSFMFTSRSSTTQWSLIFLCLHQDPLHGFSRHWGPMWGNGHWFLYIKALYETKVVDFFVTSMLCTRQWSSISLNQNPLWGNGHWFPFIHQDPLRDNGYWFLCHVEALYEAMAIDLFSFRYRPSSRDWSNLFSKSQKKKSFGSKPYTW